MIRHSHVDYAPGTPITDRNPLTPVGLRLADMLAQRVSGWGLEQLYVSTMVRTQQTADAINRLVPNVPRWDMDELRETSISDMAGYDGEMPSEDLVAWGAEHFRYADQQMEGRLARGWERILAHLDASGLQRVAIVSHGAAMNGLLHQFLGPPAWNRECWVDFYWAAITCLEYGPNLRRVRWLNDSRHADPLRQEIKAYGETLSG